MKQERLQSFLRTAELLKIKGLAEQNLSGHLNAAASAGTDGGAELQFQQQDIKREVGG